jgi:stearoyl-CoA desaturase (Delta-9 desaturase)
MNSGPAPRPSPDLIDMPPWHDFSVLRFWGFHAVAVFGTLYAGVTTEAAICCVVLYFVRMFGVTAGYHRYFSHRTFKTSRVFAYLLALLATTSAQQGVIWWARNHRHHHRHSDGYMDIHSPVKYSFWRSHCNWIFLKGSREKHSNVADLERCKELHLLETYPLVPPTILALACLWFFGWSGYFFGFFMSTILVWHGTFTINSLSHVWGSRRFDTTDDSRNNFFLALVTLGEGWHNNHHRYMRSTRQGFYWWELDITYCGLKILSWLGLIWDLRPVPEEILEEGRLQDRQAS